MDSLKLAIMRQKLAPTTTVVRQRDGTITLEEPLSESDKLSERDKQTRLALARSAGVAASTAGSGAIAHSSATKVLSAAPGEVVGQLWGFSVAEQAWVRQSDEKHNNDDEKVLPSSVICLPATLRVATFNVWFGSLAWEHRTDALADLLLNPDKGGADYDVVCLQEMTPKVLKRLSLRKDVRSHWKMTDSGHGETFASQYGVVMMVRATLPAPVITRILLPTNMGRHALVATFDSTLAIATVHLESLNSVQTRTAQLQNIHTYLARFTTALLTGDFNISATGPYARPDEHAALVKSFPLYTDLWVLEQGGDGDDESAAGFGTAVTFDTTINTMNRTLGHGAECSRYDRVMVKDGGGEGSNIRIIGNIPIRPRPKDYTNDIFISDHFGLAFDMSTHVAD